MVTPWRGSEAMGEDILEEDGVQEDDAGVEVGAALAQDVQGAAAALGAVGAHGVEEELIGSSFLEEVSAVAEGLDAEELVLDEPMAGFQVTLPGVGCGGDGAVEAIRGERPVNELASLYQVHPSQIAVWKRQALEGLPGIFGNGRAKGQPGEEELRARLYQEIGQLKVELDFLKKRAGLVD